MQVVPPAYPKHRTAVQEHHVNRFHVSAAIATLAFVAQPALSQGMGHTMLMRGQIVDKYNNETVICLGTADGAQVNQVLSVYRIKMVSQGKIPGSGFRRVFVGNVTIDHVFDEHFAHARVSNGTVAVNDVVELQR